VSERPRILVTPWRRELPTFLGERTVLDALDPAYANRVADAGGLPLIVPRPPAHARDEALDALLDLADGLLLSGGGDVDPASYGAWDEGGNLDVDPDADRWEVDLVRAAADRRLPTLGICRGAQIMSIAFGGALAQELPKAAEHRDMYELEPEEILAERHPVKVADGSAMHDVFDAAEIAVNTIHHHAIADSGSLAATGVAAGGLIEAVEPGGELADWPALGVQWHPEKMPEVIQRRLFERLVQAARDRKVTRSP
jgi:putative glutamine amidotransferase